MMVQKGEMISESEDYAKLLGVYTKVFEVIGVDHAKSVDLSKGFINEAIKRAAIRLVEDSTVPGREQILDSIQMNSSIDDLVLILADNFSGEELAGGFATGYTEIFGMWFDAISETITDEQRKEILSLLENYQTQS